MKILMVCLGNICRSPMAEGILRHKARELDLDLSVDSCGTSGWHRGEKADPRSIAKMKEKGIDISDLRARPFEDSDFNNFDVIYCMDQNNLKDLLKRTVHLIDQKKVKLILNEVNPGKNEPVPDPYFGGDEGFENVYQLLDTACDKIIDQVKK